MIKKINIVVVSVFIAVGCLLPFVSAKAAGITKYPPLRNSAFWQKLAPEADRIILTRDGIKAFNDSIRQESPYVIDLKAYPIVKDGVDIKKQIDESSVFPDRCYNKSGKMTWAEQDVLRQEMNMDSLESSAKVRTGVVVKRANIRTMPTDEAVFSEPEASAFDLFQETAADPSEPVLILHTSRSRKFYYVQMYNYSGWVNALNIAVTDDREKWLYYADPKDFLVVVDKSYEIQNGAENIFYQMGSRLPFVKKDDKGYKVVLPQRDAQGNLFEKHKYVIKNKALHKGYLEYTRDNIIREAFCWLDEPYGWGGLSNSVDCSSFIADIYRTTGIFLPRNADQQEEAAGRHFDFSGFDEAKVYESIKKNCRPGDALYMDGHTMLYLGQTNGVPYIIHALGSYTKFDGGQKSRQRVLQVVVSDLSLRLSGGDSFAAALTSAVSFH